MIQGGGDANGDKDTAQPQQSPANGHEHREHSPVPEQPQILQPQIPGVHGQRIALAQPVASAVIATPIAAAGVGGSAAGGTGNATYQHYLIPGVSLGGQIQNIAIPAQVTVSVQQSAVHAGGTEPLVTSPAPTYTISSPQSLARILAAVTQSYTVRTGAPNSVTTVPASGIPQQIHPQDKSAAVAVNVQSLQLQKVSPSCTVLTLPVASATMAQRAVIGSGGSRQDTVAVRLASSPVAVTPGHQQQALILDTVSSPAVQPGDVTRVHSYSLASASSTVAPSTGNVHQLEVTNTGRAGLSASPVHQKGLSPMVGQVRQVHSSLPHKRIASSGSLTPVNTTLGAPVMCVSVSSVNSIGTSFSFTTAGTDMSTSSSPSLTLPLSYSNPSPLSGPKPKRVKLEEKPPSSEEIGNKRKRICDYRWCEVRMNKELYREHLTELFFLQNGGNMMDFWAWRKRPVPQLIAFLRANVLDSDDEEDQKLLAEVKTPTSVSAMLTAGSAFSGSSRNLQQGSRTSSEQPSQLPKVQSPTVTTSSHSQTTIPRQHVTFAGSVTYKTPGTLTPSPPSTSPAAFKPMKSPQVMSLTTNKLPTRQHSISAVYDSTIGSQEEIVERAKQEAYVMQRISELRKEGLWSLKRLPKVQEPPRNKAQWDYLLEEMIWLATDFAQERKWKKAAAKKCARMVMKYHQERELKAEKAEKEEQQRLRKIAGQLSKEVKQFWTNIEKLVEYKQQTWLEEKRKKALDLHLNFIVDQTEKYSSWLTQGMNRNIQESTGTSVASSSVHESQPSSPAGSHHVSSNDEDFEPDRSESDDEETIAKEEAEGIDEEEQSQEIEMLQKESEVPLEELLKTLPPEIFETPDSPTYSNHDKDVEAVGEIDTAKCDPKLKIPKTSELRSEEENDDEFSASNLTADDDETTIREQESKENQEDYDAEIKDLQNEAEMSLEDLYTKYADAYASDSEMPDSVKSSDNEPEEEEEKEDDEDEGEQEEEAESIGEDSEKPEEDRVSDMNTAEDEDDAMLSEEDEVVDVGMECLINLEGTTLIEKKESKKGEKNDKGKGPSKEITDIAAAAESFQPKGNTLSTTQVCTKVPFLLKHQLREYQHIGLEWLVAMNDRKLNGILADEMGLGKTIQTIALLAHLACDKGVWGPHLIVVPTSVMLNWEMEFKKWCPAFKILTYYGAPKERKQKRQGWTKPNAFHVCITSYKLVIQDHFSFRRKRWKYFILDEAQHIKNFKSQRWQMLLNFQSSHRLLLTGTPLQNSLMELWSLMHFLMPNVFQSHREFRDWFANPVTGMIEGSHEYNEGLIKRLHKVLRPFLLRRLKSEVEKQLPKKYEHVIMCRLSKRQRYLYDDFMSQAKTKETLASGNFMSVINVLMQLRKVCNHPNMFEPRPTVSPFMMKGISYYTASLVWQVLDYDPLKHVSFWALNLLLADLELCLTAFAAHRIKKFQTPATFIQDIDNYPDPPPRCPPGKIRLHIRTSNPPNQHSSSGHSSPIHPRTPSPVPTGRTTTTPLVTRLPSVAHAQTAVPNQQRLMIVSSPNSTPPPRATSPVAALATSQALGTSQSTEYTLQLIQQQTTGGVPVAQLSSTGGQVLASTPITVQIQQSTQGGARLAMPLGIGRLVQTSTGQHLLLTPTVSGVSTADSQQLLSPIVSTAPITGIPNNPAAVSIPPSVLFQGPPIGTATVLPQTTKALVSSTPIPPPHLAPAVNKLQPCPSTTVTTTGFSAPVSTTRPVVRVAPLSINQQGIVPTTATTITGSSVQLLKSPVVHSLGKPVTRSETYVHSSLRSSRGTSLFYLEPITEKKEQHRYNTLRLLGQINSLRCAACPIYGRDLIEAVTVTSSMKPYTTDRSWGQMRYVNCLNAPYAEKRTREYWLHTRTLSEMILTPELCLMKLRDIIDRFVIIVPGVAASPIQMHTSHPPPSMYNKEQRRVEILHREVSPRCAFLHPITNRTRTQFPELRLIQYDCGKLQTLDKLLWHLKSGNHRILIFTQMTRMLDVLEQFLNYHGHTYLRLDGNTRVDQRQALMERFNADKRIFCFILSTRSGGIGVNLTGADTVIFYDSDWNPTMDAQAQDRCHRIGQTRDVHIYRLISERTVEENILKKANQKRLLGDLAIEGGNFTTAFFKKNTIQELFGFNFVFEEISQIKIEDGTKLKEEIDDKNSELQEKFSQAQLEQALGMAEEEMDVQAARTARAEAAAELAEFDESIPLDTDSRDNEEKSPAEEELEKLMEQLTPVEKYAMQFLESLQEPFSLEQLKQAEEEIEAQKKDWELGRLKALKEEEERRAGLREDDEDPLLTYSRADAYNQVYISYNGQQNMPMWAPPTPPQDENDLYIDYSMGFAYEHSLMPESQLPPLYIKKETKRLKMDSTATTVVTTRKQKVRKEETVNIPRSLFDRPTAAILKMRREAKLQKVKGLIERTSLPKSISIGMGLGSMKQSTPVVVNKPTVDTQQDSPEWLVHEDWAILQIIQTLQDLPLSLTVLSPAHIPNWDLVADTVNAISRTYRSPKQCKNRYESVIVLREEGKILYDTNPKKQKKTKGIYKTKNNRPMRTSQLYIQDNNASFTALYNNRFETIKAVANKRTPTLKSWFVSPTGKNPKHAAVLAENGINYDQPLNPVQLAAIRAERIAREKQKSQAAAAAAAAAVAAEQQLVVQRQQQQQQQASVTAQVAGAAGLIQHQATQAVLASLSQAQQLQAIQAGQLAKASLQAGTVTTVSLAKSLGSGIVVNTAAGSTSGTFISKALGQTGATSVSAQSAVQSVTAAGTLRTQRPTVTAASNTTTTMTVQEMVAAAAGQVRALSTTSVTGSTTPAVVSVAGLTAVQLHSASQRINTSGLTTTTTAASGGSLSQVTTQTASTRNLTQSQLQAFKQTALLRQQRIQEQQLKQQQQLKRLQVAAQQQTSPQGAVGTKVAVSVNSPLTASVAAVAAAAAAQQRAAQQQAAAKQTLTRGITEAEVAQLLKRQQQLQQQKQAAVAAQLTTAQILAQAQIQQVQQQQHQQQQQAITGTVQTPVATLVKTVSAPTSLGVTPSVTIPVSAVTMAGVNINVTLPQGKATGTPAKGTTPAATAVTQQQLRHLQIQHQLMQQRKVQLQQQQQQQKVASLAQVAKVQGKNPTAAALPSQLSTVQIVQHGAGQPGTSSQAGKTLQTATAAMTVQQIQQVIKQVLPQHIPLVSAAAAAAAQGTGTAAVNPAVTQTPLLSHTVLQAVSSATPKPIATVTLAQTPSPSQTPTSVGVVSAPTLSTASSPSIAATVQARMIPVSQATVSSPAAVANLAQPQAAIKQTIQVVTAAPSLTANMQAQQALRVVADPGIVAGALKSQAVATHTAVVTTPTAPVTSTTAGAVLKGTPAVVVSGQPQAATILQQVSPATSGLTAQQAVTLAVRAATAAAAAAVTQAQGQPQVQIQVQQAPGTVMAQQPQVVPTVQSSHLQQTVSSVTPPATALGLAQPTSLPAVSQSPIVTIPAQTPIVTPIATETSQPVAQVALPTVTTPSPQPSVAVAATGNVSSATAQAVQAAIQAAKQQQAQQQQRASPYTMRLRNPPKQ